jgi:hypothetical protein
MSFIVAYPGWRDNAATMGRELRQSELSWIRNDLNDLPVTRIWQQGPLGKRTICPEIQR